MRMMFSEDAVCHKAVIHGSVYLHAGWKTVSRFIMMTEKEVGSLHIQIPILCFSKRKLR